MTGSDHCAATAGSLERSEDGYIRLTFQRFCRLRFARRLTVVDHELRSELQAQDVPAFTAGYCDWLDLSTSVDVRVVWAWFATDPDAPQLLAPGGVCSNVMIISPAGNDLGVAKTNDLLEAWLSSQRWQEAAHRQHDTPRRESLSVH